MGKLEGEGLASLHYFGANELRKKSLPAIFAPKKMLIQSVLMRDRPSLAKPKSRSIGMISLPSRVPTVLPAKIRFAELPTLPTVPTASHPEGQLWRR